MKYLLREKCFLGDYLFIYFFYFNPEQGFFFFLLSVSIENENYLKGNKKKMMPKRKEKKKATKSNYVKYLDPGTSESIDGIRNAAAAAATTKEN